MDPADQPQPGDPALNALSLLEVIGESREDASQRVKAARDMMVPYAIRAILDGADPVHVAKCCGFKVDTQPPAPEVEAAADMFNRMTGGLFYAEPTRDDEWAGFLGWILAGLKDLIINKKEQ